MDYSFYIKKLGHIPNEVRVRILEDVAGIDRAKTSKNFRAHDGYSVTEAKTLNVTLLDPIKSYMPNSLTKRKALDLEVGVLAPMSVLKEHTDNNPPSNRGWWVQRIHKVHIVLQSENGWCTHRRSAKEVAVKQSMEQGGIYLFNNYIFHSVGNPAKTDRVHLVAQYQDDNWDLKLELYEHLNLTGVQPY